MADYTTVAKVGSIKEGTGAAFTVNDRIVAVFLENGEYHAIDDLCPHMAAWLDKARSTAAQDYALAVEILRIRRLIKGYSDTHQRGAAKFDLVVAGVEMVRGQPDAARQVNRLIAAAREDENGTALNTLLAGLSV